MWFLSIVAVLVDVRCWLVCQCMVINYLPHLLPMYQESVLLHRSTNHFDEGNELPGPAFTLVSKPSSCLFNALFKPSDALLARSQVRYCDMSWPVM